MELDKFMISLIIFSVMLTSGVFLIQDINVNYEKNLSTSDFNDTYNTIDKMYNLSQDMKNHTIDADISDDESWESMTKGSYSAVRLVKDTFKLFGDISNNLASALHVPSYFIKFLMAAITIMIVFAVIYLFLRFKPGS